MSSAFPSWGPLKAEDFTRWPGINSRERRALTTAGEAAGENADEIIESACQEISVYIRSMLANNKTTVSYLNETGMYDIPFSLRVVAWPLVIRWLFLRYQLPLSQPREKSIERAEELLERYANSELQPEGPSGETAGTPAYMQPLFSSRESFAHLSASYRDGGPPRPLNPPL